MMPKKAVTVVAADIDTVQVVAVELEQPLQLVKVEPGEGTAVSTTTVPPASVSLQSMPHEMPMGALVTVPLPPPGIQPPPPPQ